VKLSRAVDLWMGELARAGRTPSTRFSYERYLFKFVKRVDKDGDADVRDVTVNDCRTFLDKWIGHAPSTVGSIHSALNGLFGWLYLENEVEANPMVRIKRPRRLRPEDVEVVVSSPADVEKMLAGTQGWQEFLCLSVLAYTGVRRDSACRLRWRDVDLVEGLIGFREKGNNQSVKPMPWELLEILRAAVESNEVACGPNDYVSRTAVPPRCAGRNDPTR
jgi:integrase